MDTHSAETILQSEPVRNKLRKYLGEDYLYEIEERVQDFDHIINRGVQVYFTSYETSLARLFVSQAVGCCGIAVLTGLGVFKPEKMNKGLGTYLTKLAEAMAAYHGYTKLTATTAEEYNPHMIRIFNKLDYRIMDSPFKNIRSGSTVTMWIKDLPRFTSLDLPKLTEL